jgi:kynurenine 3-monooxygenase
MPYHYKDRGILLGDSAHSMVPFYGQGLNCGLEDVRILQVLFSEANVASSSAPDLSSGLTPQIDRPLASALGAYTTDRHEDLLAISDLAMAN